MISVIIPVYNVEKYLDRCLESIVNQTYRDLEIILVDDGSPDSCPQMCDDWAAKDQRIKVIHKENAGQGYARNTGLDAATGEWVSFVDSDDYLDLNTYTASIAKADHFKADVCYFGTSGVSASGKVYKGRPNFPEVLSGEEIRKVLLPMCYGRFPSDKFGIGSVWIGLYRRDFLEKNKIRFFSERELICEDYVFSADVCKCAGVVSFVNCGFYHYCVNMESTSRKYQHDRFERGAYFHANRLAEIEKLELGNNAVLRAHMRYWVLILAAIKSDVQTNQLPFAEKIQHIRKICRHEYTRKLSIKDMRMYLNWKQRLFLYMIKARFSLGVYILAKLKENNPEI